MAAEKARTSRGRFLLSCPPAPSRPPPPRAAVSRQEEGDEQTCLNQVLPVCSPFSSLSFSPCASLPPRTPPRPSTTFIPPRSPPLRRSVSFRRPRATLPSVRQPPAIRPGKLDFRLSSVTALCHRHLLPSPPSDPHTVGPPSESFEIAFECAAISNAKRAYIESISAPRLCRKIDVGCAARAGHRAGSPRRVSVIGASERARDRRV